MDLLIKPLIIRIRIELVQYIYGMTMILHDMILNINLIPYYNKSYLWD